MPGPSLKQECTEPGFSVLRPGPTSFAFGSVVWEGHMPREAGTVKKQGDFRAGLPIWSRGQKAPGEGRGKFCCVKSAKA